MSTPEKSYTESLAERVAEVSFMQFLRKVQIESGKGIGVEKKVAAQPIQLVPELDPAFPASEITRWEPSDESHVRPRLFVAFQGIFGPQGVLPDHYTQTLLERVRNKDYSLYEFLNIFNNRLLGLFYRAWEKHAYPISMERAWIAQGESPSEQALFALTGNRLPGACDQLSFNDSYLIYYGGLFASPRPSQASLQNMITDFSGMQCAIEPLVGEWHSIDVEDQTQVAIAVLGANFNNVLGKNTIVGDRVWDVENRFSICVGPLTWDQFVENLPNQPSLRQIADLTQRYVGNEWEFEIRVLVAPDEVRGVTLGVEEPFYLGWNSWLGVWNSPSSARDAVFIL